MSMNWIKKAAGEIWLLASTHQMIVPPEKMIVPIIAAHAEPLVALLREARREHRDEGGIVCQTFYGRQCTCDADEWNARIDAVLGKQSPD